MKLVLYCSNVKSYLYKTEKPMIEKKFGDYHTQLNKAVLTENLNGKILAECDFEVDKIEYKHIKERDKFGILHNEAWYEYKGLNVSHYDCDLASRSGFDDKHSLFDYLFDYLIDKEGYPKDGYAVSIKNLHIFDEPRELDDYEYIIYLMCS